MKITLRELKDDIIRELKAMNITSNPDPINKPDQPYKLLEGWRKSSDKLNGIVQNLRAGVESVMSEVKRISARVCENLGGVE